jgi:type VI protein secretion system component VasK
MSKEKNKKSFWQRFKWWLYAVQWVFTGIGVYIVVQWMMVPENRKNAAIGAVILAGFLLFGAIAVWRRKASKKKAAAAPQKSETTQKKEKPSGKAKDSGEDARQGSDEGYSVETSLEPGYEPEDDDERMKAIQEELSKHG